jgi:hypothetical protein
MSCHVEKGLWQTGKIVILHDYGKLPEDNACCWYVSFIFLSGSMKSMNRRNVRERERERNK